MFFSAKFPDADDNACRITALYLWDNERYLAVGSGGGHLVVIDRHTDTKVVLQRYSGAVRAIDHIVLGKLTSTSPRNSMEKPAVTFFIQNFKSQF